MMLGNKRAKRTAKSKTPLSPSPPTPVAKGGKPPTRREAAAIEHARRRVTQELPVRIAFREGEALVSRHDDTPGFACQLAEAAGTSSRAYATKASGWLIGVSKDRFQDVTATDLGAAYAFLGAISPADEIEAAIGMQMYGAHELAMEMMAKAAQTDDLAKLQAYGNLATKFQRTFGTLFENLSKHRRGGEQVVRHVHVYPGGQAVVADTFNNHGGGHAPKVDDQSQGTGPVGELTSLRSEETLGDELSRASDAERAVSDTRR